MKQAAFEMGATLRAWMISHKLPTLFGIIFGGLWGFLTAATVTYREWLVYDQQAGIVYRYSDFTTSPQITIAEAFLNEYHALLLQATLILLVLSGVAGWSTWQLTRIQPRGEEQPPLKMGTDWYIIGLAIGGLCTVALFRFLGLAIWFKGTALTFPIILNSAFGFLLPLYAGVALFLVWFRRLKSVRAPDWETHHPKRTRKKGGGESKGKLFRQKGGKHRK